MSSSMGLAPPLPIPTQPSATPPLPPITGTGPPTVPSLSAQLLPPAPPQPPPYPPPIMTMYNNSNTNGPIYNEEISTIFVVGFPDDMQEREFQNMFIFSPGFEAATLKVPSKDGEDDPNVSTVNGNSQNKKQIIGFAKFRSRGEALDAKDTISGRKVDAEKGSVLKAEMAKKNLHTKRGLSSNDPFQLNQLPAMLPPHDLLQQHLHHPSVPPIPTASYQQQQDDNNASVKRSTGPHHSSVYEAFHSVPASDPTLISDIYSDIFIPNTTNSNNNGSSTGIRSMQPVTTSTSATNPSTRLSGLFSPTHRFSSGNIFDLPQRSDIKPPIAASSSNGEPVDLLEKVDPPISYVNPSTLAAETAVSPSSSIPHALHQQQSTYQYHHHHHHHKQQPQHLHLHSSSPPSLLTNRFIDDNDQQQLGSAFGGLTINTNSLHSTNITNSSATTTTTTAAAANTISLTSTPTTIASNGGLPSPGLISPSGYRSFSTMMMMASTNPADQNPPCNTLYVGNLPPNTDEEELKQLFSKCVGYKRLSFRQKANGPMCFVEFDDVYCATMALQDLYGNPLSNSVKGGIRLSFSKNPLGVRQNSISNSGCNATNGVFNPLPYYRDNLSFDPPYS